MGSATAPPYYFPPTPPPSSPPLFPQTSFADVHKRSLAHPQTPQSQPDCKSPLFQRIIPKIGYLSPIYNYLTTPTATPPPSRPGTASFSSTEETYVEGEFSDEGDEDEMVKTSAFRFSASAGNRTFAIRQPTIDSILSPPTSEDTYIGTDTPTSLRVTRSSKVSFSTVDLHNKNKKHQTSAKVKGSGKDGHQKKIPACYGHRLRHPDSPASCDVVPCDWVRPRNSHRFNNYTNADVQCRVPKCETCIADETYGRKSVWALSAPEGQTAESHRLRSRVRYLCNRCEQPAPPPPEGGFGPIEMCTCVLRDHAGLPTDIWFQCSDCAESNWFEHDARFRNPDGKAMLRKARKRKNKYGIVVQPRKGGLVRVKRCCCGRMVPKDARYGIWCTWCNCPVDGEAGVELGGAATRSGPGFVVKKDAEDASESENEEDIEDDGDDDDMMVDLDGDDVTESDKYTAFLEGDTIMGEAEDSGIEV